MKTAISIPDDVFEQADQAAKRLGLSRSEFVTRAVRAFLETRAAQNITNSHNEAFGDESPGGAEAFVREASRRALVDVEWEER